jgi:hypothetical protein
MTTRDSGSTPEIDVLDELARDADPFDLTWLKTVSRFLATPRPLDDVEQVEMTLKQRWRRFLSSEITPTLSLRFSSFFSTIGFLRKYKPYGVKYAAPFGYSIFALRPFMGFSVQLHRISKIEVFHILRVLPGAFVLLCSTREWETEKEAFRRSWERGRPNDSSLTYPPVAGDIVVVKELSTVHSIIGCVLEEYATTSNDAVERLYDQNTSRNHTRLPTDHPPLLKVLREAQPIKPKRYVQRSVGGWTTTLIDETPMLSLCSMRDRGLQASHICLENRSLSDELYVPESSIVTLTILEGRAEIVFRAGHLSLSCGDTVPIAPGEVVTISACTQSCLIARCEVDRDLAFTDLRDIK